ncbi:MAG: hypothetical protein GF308_12855 [Candidatus Heimdallarchaeota archaeon]|nr:hypothetical protein [Candidatus Heimdallarchaeota archaeon]
MPIPLAAVVTEGIAFLVVLFVVISLYIRYSNRRKPAALTLAVAFNFWDLGALCLFTGKLLTYILEQRAGGELGPDQINFSHLGINLGYGFSALSNVFLMVFVAQIFSQTPFFRRTKMTLPIIAGAFNGITIGLVIEAIRRTWPVPSYNIGPTVYHLILTFIAFGSVGIFSIRPLRNATFRWEKAGFIFIIVSSIFGILIYLSFAIDVILPQASVVFEGGYTPFYYLGYVFAIFMCAFAYFGYVMPKFIRDIFREQQSYHN